MDPRRRGVLQHEPLRLAAALHAARGRVRHLPARVRGCLGRRWRVPAHHASAHQRLPLACLDTRRADPPRPRARRRVVRHARRHRALREGKRLSDYFSGTQIVRKAVVPTRGGVVAAQHRRAAEAGAAILEAGGDAVDAAVATSFAIGVVEPWMSGPAAGGCMVIWRASEAKAYAIDYGMRAPRAPRPAGYSLARSGAHKELFSP